VSTVPHRAEVGVEVEGGLRRRHDGAGGREAAGHRPDDLPVQPAAERDPLGQFGRVAEGEGGRLLDRRGRRGPDLAADADQARPQPPAQVLAGLRVGAARQPRGTDPPAAQGEALAECGGDDRAARGVERRAGERHRRVVHEVPVDLVGDDDQVVLLGDLAQFPDRPVPGQRAGRVVREGEDDRTDLAPVGAGLPHGGSELAGVGHAALAGPDVHEVGPGAEQAGLRRVGDPAGPGHRDITADGEHQPEQQ